MGNLSARFASLKQKVGGNREKMDFEWSFGQPVEEQVHVTPPNRGVIRILSEVNFALGLSEANGGKFDGQIERALAILERDYEANEVLTRGACHEAEQALLELSGAAKEYEILCVSHAHIDMNWMWGWQETVAATLSTFRTMLNLMREYPEFTYSQSQASVYQIVEEYEPEMMEEIKQRIAEGRWEITATAWVETDKNMPDTESLIRHIRHTRDYLKEHWGIDPNAVKVDFSPDTFGHSAFVPEINTFGSVKYYYHCRGLQEDLTLYRYRAPSGSEVLMYKEPYWYNGGVTPDFGTGIFGLAKRCAGLKTGMAVYGVGNHGGGPTRRDVERIIEMQGWPVFPAFKFGTLHEFFKKAEAVYDQLPVVEHELNFMLVGCYTTQSRIKLGNRRSEAALIDAEKLSALASLKLGAQYPAKGIEKGWENVLFTHFHDIVTGSCVQESREHAMGLYAQAQAHAQSAQARALRLISEQVDTSMFKTDDDISTNQAEGAGVGFGLDHYAGVPNPERGAGKTRIYTVFNAASSCRKELVEITMWDYVGDLRRLEVVDAKMQPVRFQLLDKAPQKYWDHRYVRLLIEAEVAGFGYATYAVRERPVESYPTFYLKSDRVEKPLGPLTLENEHLKATFAMESGALISLIDKATGEEQILEGQEAGLKLLTTEHASSSAWRIGRHLKTETVDGLTDMSYAVKGELHNAIEMKYRLLDSLITTTVSLDAGAKALAYEFEVDWREYTEKGKTVPVLSYMIPLKNGAEQVLMDVPAGAKLRDAEYIDMAGLSFAACAGKGAAPVLMANCKYGYRLAGGVLSCTLINTADAPDKYPERGIHNIKLWVAVEEPKAKALKQLAEALNRPMVGVPTASHPGQLAEGGALMSFESGSTVFSSAGLCSCGKALDVRVFEIEGKADQVTIHAPFEPSRAELVNLNGEVQGVATVDKDVVRFDIAPHKIAQVRIYK